jgi:hypothetical protein
MILRAAAPTQSSIPLPSAPAKKPFYKRKVVVIGIILLVIIIAVAASAANRPSTSSGTSPNPGTSQNKAVTITHSPRNLNGIGAYSTPASGKVYLVVNMTIQNRGYDKFEVNPFYFKVVVDSVAYSYSIASSALGDEGYTYLGVASVLDGGKISGALAFEVPKGYSLYSMQYNGFSTYTINWVAA